MRIRSKFRILGLILLVGITLFIVLSTITTIPAEYPDDSVQAAIQGYTLNEQRKPAKDHGSEEYVDKENKVQTVHSDEQVKETADIKDVHKTSGNAKEYINEVDNKKVTTNISRPVLWHANFDKLYSSRGFIYEWVNFLVPLSKTSLLVGWWPKQTFSSVTSNEFLNEFNQSDVKVMHELYHKGEDIIKRNDYIAIIVEQPSQYKGITRESDMKNAVYKVGRAMFETTWIPNGWDKHINDNVDELWVPSNFAKAVFKNAGVTKPIYVIPEGFDPELYVKPLNQEERRKKRQELFLKCQENDVIFFTGKYKALTVNFTDTKRIMDFGVNRDCYLAKTVLVLLAIINTSSITN